MVVTFIRAIKVLFVITLFLLKTEQLLAVSNVTQVFLIQNSGWMLPFYEDPDSRFKDIGVELSSRVRQYGGEWQVVASFNQSLQDNQSPSLHYMGTDQGKVNQAIRSITPLRKPGKKTYTDTDFKEAIIGAIKTYSSGKPCILWILTNNKNSPDNNQETVEKNKEFYRFLQETDQIKRIVAFPYPMKVHSRTLIDFKANGLMIYALAYGDESDQFLQKMLRQNAPFGNKAARLKPLNTEALTFIPKTVKGSKSLKASIIDGKTLLLSFDASSKPETAQIIGRLRNDFYPYDIRSANVAMISGFHSGKNGIQSNTSATKINKVQAGEFSSDIIVTLKVPPIPSPWDPEVIFGSGYSSKGSIKFDVTDQRLDISKKFVSSMSELFPNDPLPDLFVPGEYSEKSVTIQPVLIKVVYPSWPLFVLGLLLLIIFCGIIVLAIILRREKIYRVSIDGIQKSYGLRPFVEVVIKNEQGERVGVLKRGLALPVFILDKGKNCTFRIT